MAVRIGYISSDVIAGDALHERPAELLQRLIRFDTTNPPGAERACVEWVASLLRAAGIEPKIVARDPQRPSLVARLPGTGVAPGFLMQGHLDVVPAEGEWSHPPFGADIADGYVWGRGALDMKGGVAMMLAAFLRAVAAGEQPAGDVVLCLLSDEEARGELGARFVVEEHPELFEGVKYAIGEFGGFSLDIAGRRFYPMMVAEKQLCVVRATVRGRAGHGSLPVRDAAMTRLGRLLSALDRRLPVHVTPVARSMIEAIASEVPAPAAVPLRGLLRPRITDLLLDRLGERGTIFSPVLHNTASATIVRGGQSANVIPGEASVDIDCRLLPGFGPDHVLDELRDRAGIDLELEVLYSDPPGPAAPDMSLFPMLGAVLKELDAEARPVPLLFPAVSDGRFFARLGIQTYGFLPMQLTAELRFMELVHAPDERIPVEALEFGTTAMHRVLGRLGGA